MILFVGGIDTGVGKSMATGLMARWFALRGFKTVTQKLVQTGCENISEDIVLHRKLMGIDLLPEDRSGLTCPCVFRFPGSPHLAAALEGMTIEPEKLVMATKKLASSFDVVIVEGAGGLLVPLTEEITTLDLLSQQNWPVALVSTSRLGSINHSLLSIDALRHRGCKLVAVIYNLHNPTAPEIVCDTRRVIERALARIGYNVPIFDLPAGSEDAAQDLEFNGLI